MVPPAPARRTIEAAYQTAAITARDRIGREESVAPIEMGAGIAASPHCAERRICRYS